MNKSTITLENGQKVEAVTPVIVSASRSTDIPAFYLDWFIKRLEIGYSVWINPFNQQSQYVSYEKTKFIVFWSKDPSNLIPYIPFLKNKGINFYIQYTLNDYQELELNVPSIEKRLSTFKELSNILGKASVIWRFDPLILTDSIDIETLLNRIENIGNQLKDYTNKLVFSFADIGIYKKVQNNLIAHNIHYREWSNEEMDEFAEKLTNLNKVNNWNFEIATCAEKINLDKFGISHNKCVDDNLIIKLANEDKDVMDYLGVEIQEIVPPLFGEYQYPINSIKLHNNKIAIKKKDNKDKGQRSLCGCMISKDIGQYNTCPHGCIYCYANSNKEIALFNYKKHLNSFNKPSIL